MRGYSGIKFWLFLACFFPFEFVNGQDAIVVPASIQAMGGGGASLPAAESISLNPASASAAGFTAGISYGNRFLLYELSAGDAVLVIPVSGSRLFGQIGQFGSNSFHENYLGIGLARKFGEHFSGGIQFHYYQLRMAESDRKPGLLTSSLGLNYTFANYGVGLSVFNPLSQQMTSNNFSREYPMVARLGGHKVFGDDFLVVSQITWGESTETTVHAGLQYFLLDRFCMRAGVQTSSPNWSMGVGFLVGHIQADLAFSYHEYLGFSPSVSLYFKRQ